MFKEYRNEVKKQAGKVIKILWSNRHGEYLNGEFQSYRKENNIVSHGHLLNGVSKKRNRTLLDVVLSMVSYMDLLISLRGYALLTVTYVLNRIPSKAILKYHMKYDMVNNQA